MVMQSDRAMLLDIEQLANRLGVSVRYVRRLVAERRIEYIKVGHLVRFEPQQVERWIDHSRVSALRSLR